MDSNILIIIAVVAIAAVGLILVIRKKGESPGQVVSDLTSLLHKQADTIHATVTAPSAPTGIALETVQPVVVVAPSNDQTHVVAQTPAGPVVVVPPVKMASEPAAVASSGFVVPPGAPQPSLNQKGPSDLGGHPLSDWYATGNVVPGQAGYFIDPDPDQAAKDAAARAHSQDGVDPYNPPGLFAVIDGVGTPGQRAKAESLLSDAERVTVVNKNARADPTWNWAVQMLLGGLSAAEVMRNINNGLVRDGKAAGSAGFDESKLISAKVVIDGNGFVGL